MVLTAALCPVPSSLYRKEAPENITWGRGTLRSAGIHGAGIHVVPLLSEKVVATTERKQSKVERSRGIKRGR